MARVLLILSVVWLLLAPRAAADTELPDGFAETTVYSVSGDYLTAMRFAPDGGVFAAGKSGVVFHWAPGKTTPTVFADLRRQTFDGWDRGITGLAIDPQYDAGRPYVYVAYTLDQAPGSSLIPAWGDSCPLFPEVDQAGCPAMGRVSRLAPDGRETVLLEGFCDQSLSHSTGALAFGPDGDLYVSVGDGASYDDVDWGQNANPCGDPPSPAGTSLAPPGAQGGALRAQSYRRPTPLPASLDGAILRLDPDTGLAAAGNPGGPDDVRRRIVAYGFRNPFRMAFRPGTSDLWLGDVGFGTWEEIDRVPDVARVRNYGWPCYEGRARQAGYQAAGLDACASLPQVATEAPYFVYDHRQDLDRRCPAGSSSISGLAFYDAAYFPARYHGALFFADYSRGCIWAMLGGADGLPDPARLEVFASGAAMPVDLQIGPDGALYYADVFGATIRRIAPTGDAPVAKFTVTHDGDTYRFDGAGSTGSSLRYAWDFGGDGTASTAVATHTFSHHGYFTVTLRVTDARGTSGVATQRVTIGTAPTVTVDPIADRWAAGDTMRFSGSARDSDGRALTGTALRWSLDLRHCSALVPTSCHTHRMQDMTGAQGSFTAPDHEYPSHLALTLTATDADGLSASRTVDLNPRTVDVTVHSEPEGLKVGFGGETQTTPFTRAVIANSSTTLSAAAPQSRGRDSYLFAYWSDRGAATHPVAAPASRSLTATFVKAQDVTLAGTDVVNQDARSRAYPGHGEAYAMTATASGPILGLRLHLDPTSEASRMLLGVYSDAAGEAGALLASATAEQLTAGAWNEARLDAPLLLTQGTTYWFAVLNPADSTGVLWWNDRASATPGKDRTSRDGDLTAFPANWFIAQRYDAGPLSAQLVGPDPATPIPSPPPPTATATPTAAPSETATAAPSPIPPAVPTPLRTPAPRTKPTLSLPSRLSQDRKGVVRLRLRCPDTRPCRLRAELRHGRRRLGRAAATVAPGAARTLRVPVTARARHRQTVTLRVTWRGRVFSRSAVLSARPRGR
jgi:glucose/arabinose dehydrogenase/PKD repeat protein